MAILKPAYRILIAERDVTRDLAENLLSMRYVDRVSGSSDELEITLEDVAGMWRGAWYPTKGDKLSAWIGYEGKLMACGAFEIDQISLNGDRSTDTVTIRGLAAGPGKAVRTNRTQAYEKQTLKQIAEAVAKRNGLRVSGDLPTITLERQTQENEPDLEFLAKIANEYGVAFSLRGDRLVFASLYDLEAAAPVLTLERGDLDTYGFDDNLVGVYSSCEVSYHVPKTKKTERHTVKAADTTITSGDVLKLNMRAENRQQAEAKAKAALHKANSKHQAGRLALEGDPRLLAGVNFTLGKTLGAMAGKWHITESVHVLSGSSAYGVELTVKGV